MRHGMLYKNKKKLKSETIWDNQEIDIAPTKYQSLHEEVKRLTQRYKKMMVKVKKL